MEALLPVREIVRVNSEIIIEVILSILIQLKWPICVGGSRKELFNFVNVGGTVRVVTITFIFAVLIEDDTTITTCHTSEDSDYRCRNSCAKF